MAASSLVFNVRDDALMVFVHFDVLLLTVPLFPTHIDSIEMAVTPGCYQIDYSLRRLGTVEFGGIRGVDKFVLYSSSCPGAYAFFQGDEREYYESHHAAVHRTV